eukprot:bmy_20944T0
MVVLTPVLQASVSRAGFHMELRMAKRPTQEHLRCKTQKTEHLFNCRGAPGIPDYLRSAEMTEVMMNTPSMEEIGLNPRKDGLSYQIFPDPSDFDRCCKLKDRLPSIVVEPTEGEVESGELRWPPEEFLVQEDEQDNCEETPNEDKEQ